MATNRTEINFNSSEEHLLTVADKAAEIFTKPIDVTSFVVCIVGLVINCFSITATAHIPRGQSTHAKLIISLGISDSLILLAILLRNFMYIFSSWDDCTKVTKRLLLDIALLATLTNLLVMAVDHYFAIVKPLHYRRFMSNFRGNCLVVFIWLFSIATGCLEMIIGLIVKGNTQQSLCTVISQDEFEIELIIIGFIFFVLFVIVVIYTRIYILVKRLMLRDRMMYKDETHGYKAIITTMLIIGTFTLLWAPDGIFQIYMYVKVESDMMYIFSHLHEFTLINDILFLLLQLNSLVDPLIYAIRLRDVQRGYKVVFYKLFPNQRYSINEEEFRQHHLSFTCTGRDSTIPSTMINETSAHDNLLGNDLERSQEESFICEKHLGNKRENANDDNNGKENSSDICDTNDHDTDDNTERGKSVKIANNNVNTPPMDTKYVYNQLTD